MKYAQTILFASLVFGFSMSASAVSERPMIETDPSKIFGSGNPTANPHQQIKLVPGIYAVGNEDHKVKGTDYMLVSPFSNDTDKVLALYIDQDLVASPSSYNSNRGLGKIFLGQKIKGGTAMKFSPLFIDVNGNVANESEVSRSARIFEISVRANPEKYRYPYLVQGHNGATSGHILGMRRITASSTPKLLAWPSTNVFRGQDRDDNLYVSGSTVSVHNGRSMDRTFQMQPLNGEMGQFAELVEATFDTMTDEMSSETEVKKLAIFMKTSSNNELFILATPTAEVGQFKFEVYGPQCRSFMDALFPGSL